MNVDEDGAVACPVGVNFHEFVPDAVCGKQECGAAVLDDGGVFAVGGDDVEVVDVERTNKGSYRLFAPDSVILPDCVRDRFRGVIVCGHACICHHGACCPLCYLFYSRSTVIRCTEHCLKMK